MKNAITLLFVLFTFITCSKKNDPGCISVTPQSESAQIAAFCDANGISYTVDANGIYYQFIDQDSGITPNANSTVTVTYTTSTLDGNVVEDKSTSPVTEALSDFIEGWRVAGLLGPVPSLRRVVAEAHPASNARASGDITCESG